MHRRKETSMRRQKISFSLLFVLIIQVFFQTGTQAQTAEDGTGSTAIADRSPRKYETIHNDFYWVDQNGARILTRSGCLCQFNGLFYWYGGNPRGFREQYCYTSKDLVHWTNQGRRSAARHRRQPHRRAVQRHDEAICHVPEVRRERRIPGDRHGRSSQRGHSLSRARR